MCIRDSVYTVLHRQYASYFGFTSSETEKLLKDFSLSLNQKVKSKYDGYLFGGIEIYNPWSLLNYADSGELHGYWVNTSSNYLIKRTLSEADKNFWTDFDRLASGNQIPVWLTLETSYIEREMCIRDRLRGLQKSQGAGTYRFLRLKLQK